MRSRIRNRRPFEESSTGKYRVWTGHGGEWVPLVVNDGGKLSTRQIYIPVKPLTKIGRVDEEITARRVVRKLSSGRVHMVGRMRLGKLYRDKIADAWYMVTDFG